MTAPLQKRKLINLVLLTAITALALLAWLGPDNEKHATVTVSDVDKRDINHIAIERNDKPKIVLEKTDDNWFVTEPLHIYANDFRVNSILNLLGSTSKKQYAIDSLEPAEFGLDKPVAILHLNNLEFRFGQREPISGERYLQFGKTLHLVEDNVLPLLTQPLDAFIDHKVLPEQKNVVEFQLPLFTVSHTEQGGWRITPEDNTLGADDLQEWVDQWRYVQALRIEQRDDDSKGAPLFVATLADGSKLRYRIVDNKQWRGFYRADLQLAYIMSEHSFAGLISKPKAAPPRDDTDTDADEATVTTDDTGPQAQADNPASP